MEIITQRRNDPPPAANEFEVHPGNLANAPVRVTSDHPLPQVQMLVEHAKRLEAEIADRSAQLALERARAMELLQQFDDLEGAKRDAAAMVARCESEIQAVTPKLARLEEEMRCWWHEEDFDLSAHSTQILRIQFLAQRLPGYLKTAQAELASAEKALMKFQTEHQKP